MSIPADLRDRVMRLDPDDRELLMYEISESLKPDEGWWEAWAEEINERTRRFESGETQAIPAEQVMAQIRERLRRRSQAS
jgi:putative addiction module component (TIGR02574 family)